MSGKADAARGVCLALVSVQQYRKTLETLETLDTPDDTFHTTCDMAPTDYNGTHMQIDGTGPLGRSRVPHAAVSRPTAPTCALVGPVRPAYRRQLRRA